MRRTSLLVGALLMLAAAIAAGAAGCFTPLQPPCAFSCAGDHLCPMNYVCGDDGFCHRLGDMGPCLLTPPDASADGDAGSGAQD